MATIGTRQLSALRQVTALGLPAKLVISELAECLKDIVGFDSASMVFLDERLAPRDLFATHDNRPHVTARYLERWFNRDEALFYPSQIRMQTDPKLAQIRVSDFSGRPGRTEIYEEIFKHNLHHWIAGIAIRNGARAIGNLGIGRPPSSSDFSDRDMALLAQVRPYLSQALSRQDEARNFSSEQLTYSETAMIVTDMAGNLQHSTSNGWRLLRQAANINADRKTYTDRTCEWARPFLAGLAQRIEMSLNGHDAPPATVAVGSPYGYFLLRAYALDSSWSDPARLICVQIERQVPIALRLYASERYRRLSLRERKVCELVASGFSHGEVASAMGVKTSTAISHTRSIYAKLGVHERESLVDALLPPTRR
jgi:DNA-binding CsgD family transcriptional regulator